MTSRALVLGGGGSTGTAWQLAVISGLRDAGVDLMDADLLVGTSAGAPAAANLATGFNLTEQVATLRDPDRYVDDRLLVDHCPFAEALTELLMSGQPAAAIRSGRFGRSGWANAVGPGRPCSR